MSSTIKRVALVAVAALGLGSVTAISANAAITSDSLTTSGSASTAATSAVVGTASTVNLVWTGVTDSAVAAAVTTLSSTVQSSPITSSPAAVTFADTTDATQVNSTFVAATGVVSQAAATGRVTRYVTASFTPDKAGTYVIKFAYTGGLNNATSYVTWTITAADIAAVDASNSTSYIQPALAANTYTWTADATVAASKSLSTGSPVLAAVIKVDARNAAGSRASATTLSASVSGTGLLAISTAAKLTGDAVPSVARAVSGALGDQYVNVYSDGNSGVSTISIYAGATLLATETVTFYGAVVSYVVTPVVGSVIDTADGVAASDTDAIVAKIQGKDASGVLFPVPTSSLVVSSTTEKTAQSITNAGAATGVTAGTYSGVTLAATDTVIVADPTATKTGAKTITITNSDATVSTTVSFVVGLGVATTLSVTGPSDSVNPGAKYTITVSSKDAGGFANPDGTRNLTITTSRASSVTVPTSGAFVNGVASIDLYAPNTAGDFTITVTDGTTTTATSTVTVTSINSSQDAIDAANEATDAANAATDAANAAAEAADAATAAAQDAQAAVAALATQVASLIAGIKAQITTLTNLVIKIQKKVKA